MFEAVVIGGSAGSIEALDRIFSALPDCGVPPILVVVHLHASDDGSIPRHLSGVTRCKVIEPYDKTPIAAGCIYTAPANYHMLVEKDVTISLSVDPKVNWSRPSIDVLFESAAPVWGERLMAVILSGANDDGARGICAVKSAGGCTIAQAPATASSPVMPQSAIEAGAVEEVLSPEEIGLRLLQTCQAAQSRNRDLPKSPARKREKESQ